MSGRGIGLDVVRDVAEQLGGEVDVGHRAGARHDRRAGRAAVAGVAARSRRGGRRDTVVSLPLDAVRTCVRARAGAGRCRRRRPGAVAYDGRAMPFLPLARALRRGAAAGRRRRRGRRHRRGRRARGGASASTGWCGTSALVVRPLPELAPAGPVVGGVPSTRTATRGSVLDAAGLVAAAAPAPAADRPARPGRPRAAADPGGRRLAHHPDARAQHPGVGRLLRSSSPPRPRRRWSGAAGAGTGCSSSTSTCPAWTASRSSR